MYSTFSDPMLVRSPSNRPFTRSTVILSPSTVMPPFTSSCAPIDAQPTKSMVSGVMPELCGSSMNVRGSTILK